MKLASVFGVVGAVLLHLGFLLFGRLLLPASEASAGSTREVELLSEMAEEQESRTEPEPEPERASADELAQDEETPPDAEEIIRSLELSPLQSAPALADASLSAIEAALAGNLGGGDFYQAMDFSSGGRIGGSGTAVLEGEGVDQAFSLADIDQKARALFQASPSYPSDLRGKKIEGVVTLTFTVDENGKVLEPRVEKSTHPSFDRPALDALKKWKFEPALRAGKRVPDRMRVSIRFQPA